MQIGTVTLPNPEWGDTQSCVVDMRVHRTMDDDVYTYVRKSSERRLTFTINNLKYIDFVALKTYLLANIDDQLTLVDWDGNSWVGYMMTNPVSITLHSRGFYNSLCTEDGDDIYDRESGSITLEFEGHIV